MHSVIFFLIKAFLVLGGVLGRASAGTLGDCESHKAAYSAFQDSLRQFAD